MAAWLPAGDVSQAGVGATPVGAPGPPVTEQQQPPPQPSFELPPAFQLLSHVTPILEEPGAYWGWAGSMEGVDHFLTAYENKTTTSFSLRTSYTLGGVTYQVTNPVLQSHVIRHQFRMLQPSLIRVVP